MEPPTPTPSPSTGPLEVGSEIGSGAIARVVRVRDPVSGNEYAGKILHARHHRDDGAKRRFQREAELATRLRHPNLVAVYGTCDLAGENALLMELVEGETLATRIACEGALDESNLLALATGITSGLAYAHATGVIHRDLKPANILLAHHSSGTVAGQIPKIADFGMARAASFAHADKRAMTVLGTPPYMAPECLEPLAVDPRTDLYALGCILFEMATGAPPYGGSTPYAVLEAHRTSEIPSLPEPYSPLLRALVSKLLAKSPGDRPQSASAVLDALRDVAGPNALAVLRRPSVAEIAQGRCASCGSDVLPDLRLCFSCGLVQVRLEPGKHTVFVVGPGKVGHRLDTEGRKRLIAWMAANEAVGLDPSELERRIPRLPFPFVEAVSEASAQTLVSSLGRLGLRAEARYGGKFAHEDVGRLAMQLTGRRLTVLGAIFGVPFFIHPALGVFTLLPALALGAPAFYLLSRAEAGRPALPSVRARSDDLPPLLRTYLDRLYDSIDSITERRHREALRAVVHRAVSLTRATSPALRPEIDAEMSHAVNLAAVATQRMDQLDRTMTGPDFDPAIAEHRALMHERDMWSARLLDLTATLDAFASRTAAADHDRAAAATDELLNSLRDMVASLEEVQRL